MGYKRDEMKVHLIQHCLISDLILDVAEKA